MELLYSGSWIFNRQWADQDWELSLNEQITIMEILGEGIKGDELEA